jgi:hypothetical protein
MDFKESILMIFYLVCTYPISEHDLINARKQRPIKNAFNVPSARLAWPVHVSMSVGDV